MNRGLGRDKNKIIFIFLAALRNLCYIPSLVVIFEAFEKKSCKIALILFDIPICLTLYCSMYSRCYPMIVRWAVISDRFWATAR
jgi:hypothetical protein